jgi:hypothetical protein
VCLSLAAVLWSIVLTCWSKQAPQKEDILLDAWVEELPSAEVAPALLLSMHCSSILGAAGVSVTDLLLAGLAASLTQCAVAGESSQ